MRILRTLAVAGMLVVAGSSWAADKRLANLDARELARTQDRLERRLLMVQQHRFEARNRGDTGQVKRASQKFSRVQTQLMNVRRESDRRSRVN